MRIASTRLPPDLGGKHRAEPVPPVPHGLVADLDASLVQQVFEVAQRQREPDVEHYRQTDDLGAGLEIPEEGTSDHLGRLKNRPAPPQATFL
jgi:hypothetical protein